MSRGGGGHPGWRGPSQGTMSKKNKILNAASSQNEDNPDVKIGIRELLLRLEPLVKVSGGNAPFESMIGFLEEMDDSSFDRYLLNFGGKVPPASPFSCSDAPLPFGIYKSKR